MESPDIVVVRRAPWNKGKLVGQKAPLKLKEIWAIRVRLQLENRRRELALFNLAIDSKLRACDLVKLRVRDVCLGKLLHRGQSCCNKRLNGRCSSKLLSPRARLSARGLPGPVFCQNKLYFLAAFAAQRICRPGSTPGSSKAGLDRLASTEPVTELIHCDGQRWLRFSRHGYKGFLPRQYSNRRADIHEKAKT